MKKIKQIWVYPAFSKKLKLNACKKDMTIKEYTKELAEMDDINIKKKKGGKGFDFKI